MKALAKLFLVCLAILMLVQLPLAAQMRPVGRIAGTVQDQTGAVVAGAKVTLVDEATNITQETTSAADGGFVFLALQVGTYKVTVTAPGFQQAVYPGLKVDASRTTNLTAQLKVGATTERIEVTGAAAALETTSVNTTTTIQFEGINNLPLYGRSLLAFVVLTPGAQMGGTTSNSTFQGLPKGSLNITLDGINDNSNRFRSGSTGMFTFVDPRLGAIEEISVTTNGMGAEAAGEGAMQMKFVTKRGTNAYHGSLFWQHRNDVLNANSWFNNAAGIQKGKFRLNEFGGNIGGPLFKDKLFFFANYEELRQPSTMILATTLLTPAAVQGNFTYRGTDGVNRTVNVLQAAAAANASLPGTPDPVAMEMLNRINASRAGAANITSLDLFRDWMRWSVPRNNTQRYPTARVDYQVTPKIRWHGIGNLHWFNTDPDVAASFPAWTGSTTTKSTRWIASSAVEWMINNRMMNEFNVGIQSNLEIFDPEASVTQFADSRSVVFPLGLPSPDDRPGAAGYRRPLPSYRNNPVWNLYDNFNWMLGKHTLTFGGAYRRATVWESWYDLSWGGAGIPGWSIGYGNPDPVTSALNTTNLPMINTAVGDLNNAWDLYALLTGRVTSIYGGNNVDEKTHEYKPYVPVLRREYQREYGFYFQDSFRASRSLTLNYGLRWELQGAMRNTNNTYTSPTMADLFGPSKGLFQPGVLNAGFEPKLYQRSDVYDSDYINPAPNFGFAWNPGFENAVLKKVFGDKKTVFRGHYGVNYYAEGMLTFTYFAGSNPGMSQTMSIYQGWPGFANMGDITLSTPGASIPFYITPEKFQFPQSMFDYSFVNQWFGAISPKLRTPYVQNWTFGIQRELTKSTVLEVRYAGNHGVHLWRASNLNEIDTISNHFVDEFILAQHNQQICQANAAACASAQLAAGVWSGYQNVNSFGDWGLSGQSPLPVMETAFNGVWGPSYAFFMFNDGNFINQVQQGQAGAMAASLATSPQYLCPLVGSSHIACSWWYGQTTPGPYPLNFFQANPYAGSAVLLGDEAWSNYHGLQLELRQQTWRGLTLRANYTFAKAFTNRFSDASTAWADAKTLRDPRYDKAPSPWDIRHTFVTYWSYDLPFGKGHRFGGNGVLDKIAGGWTVSSILRWQSGRVFTLTGGRYTYNGYTDAGVVLQPGVTVGQLQSLIQTSPGPNQDVYFINPSAIQADGRLSRQLVDVPATPGQFGQFVYLHGPHFIQPDVSILKKIPLREKMNLEFWAEFLNAFNHPNFSIGGPSSAVNSTWIDSTNFGRTAASANDPRNIQFRLKLNF